MTELTKRIVDIIKNIPKGSVVTYGTIANIAGNSRGARAVSWVLKTQTNRYNLPWFRVVNREGKISIKDYNTYNEQKALLLAEGIKFDKDDKIDLDLFAFTYLKE
ncbi:DNA methyltransferase [Thiospirochaeta perfilievii]|uniref:DNA methyltransferase n=1 Tax=Thiospirochaeta perfilievii TaxID=252967 RepID=A0A5C1QDY4_9SPIO|nr:MGMT family protein [Thiospirochaeta perfilievii]QEN06283.1 DNA methyltransferase [Thiospirochaeta perfilievii]